jgi:resorcinol 4-hydroxylase (FADH2)
MAVRNVQRIFALVGSKAGNPAHPISIAKRDVEMASSRTNWRSAAINYVNNVVLR